MQFHDTSRPRTALGLPCWLDPDGHPTTIELPAINIWPLDPRGLSPEGLASVMAKPWRVRIMAISANRGCIAHGDLSTAEIVELLVAWKDDPEGAIRHFFHEEPPREELRAARAATVERTRPISATNVSLDDF